MLYLFLVVLFTIIWTKVAQYFIEDSLLLVGVLGLILGLLWPISVLILLPTVLIALIFIITAYYIGLCFTQDRLVPVPEFLSTLWDLIKDAGNDSDR